MLHKTLKIRTGCFSMFYTLLYWITNLKTFYFFSFAKQLTLYRDIQIFSEYGVAPYTGAWIETPALADEITRRERSHPIRVRGLKQKTILHHLRHKNVAPYTGAWIETKIYTVIISVIPTCRTLYGCVDWNIKRMHNAGWGVYVAPYTGAWIET